MSTEVSDELQTRMRLTVTLLKKRYPFKWKRLWKKAGVMRLNPVGIPKPLIERGVEVIDSDNWPPKPDLPRWTPPVEDDPRFAKFYPAKDPQDDINWHDEQALCMDMDTKILEGVKQALILTKSKPMTGLPAKVQDLVGKVELPDQDTLVQRYIFHANLWNPAQEKLPRRFNPDLPRWKFKAEIGIPDQLIVETLLADLLRLCQKLGGRYPSLLTDRSLTEDHVMAAHYFFKGNKMVNVNGQFKYLLSTARHLPPMASTSDVDATSVYKLPDIFPLLPTIDLVKKNIYVSDFVTGWKHGRSLLTPHTLYIANLEKDWTTSQLNARAMMYCLGQGVLMARNKFGEVGSQLPEPISIQCVHTNGRNFNFVCFQLNTLDFASEEGIKNIFWLDSDNHMFHKLEPKRSMLRDTKYEDYNPDVFRKFLAMYLHGADL